MKLLASYETPGFDFFEAHIFSTILVIFDYILSSTGRFDLNWFTVHCSSCQWKWSPISVDSIIESGWWPGSPKIFITYLVKMSLICGMHLERGCLGHHNLLL